MTRRIFITIEYDGGPFVGWQRQDNGMSVQQVLEDAAQELTGGDCPVQGAGRTDRAFTPPARWRILMFPTSLTRRG